MSRRRQLDRERLEVYFLHLLLAYRPLLQTSGFLLLGYAVAVTLISSKAAMAALVLALCVLVPTFSYPRCSIWPGSGLGWALPGSVMTDSNALGIICSE